MRTLGKLVGMLVMARAAVNGVITRLEAMPLVMRLVCLAAVCRNRAVRGQCVSGWFDTYI